MRRRGLRIVTETRSAHSLQQKLAGAKLIRVEPAFIGDLRLNRNLATLGQIDFLAEPGSAVLHRACVSNRRISFGVEPHRVEHAPRQVLEDDSATGVLPKHTDVYDAMKGVLDLVTLAFKELLGRNSNLLDGQSFLLAKKDTHVRRRDLSWRWGIRGHLIACA
jgi:hypothetical protein